MNTFARIIDDIAVDVCRVTPDQSFCEVVYALPEVPA